MQRVESLIVKLNENESIFCWQAVHFHHSSDLKTMLKALATLLQVYFQKFQWVSWFERDAFRHSQHTHVLIVNDDPIAEPLRPD